jgi:hypothetical protein
LFAVSAATAVMLASHFMSRVVLFVFMDLNVLAGVVSAILQKSENFFFEDSCKNAGG